MDINSYDEEFTRHDDVVSENEEIQSAYDRVDTDRAFAEYVVPVYLKQISESLAILCEYGRQALENKKKVSIDDN